MSEIPKRPGHKWDGYSIFLTKDCSDCIFYRKIAGNEICGVGYAFKYLEERYRGPRKCVIKNKPNKTPSVAYLDEIVAEILV